MEPLKIIQGADRVLQSGSFVITRQSAPVMLVLGTDTLTICFDLDEPFKRPTGEVVKPDFGPDAVTPKNTIEDPKVRQLGDVRVEYSLTPTTEPKRAVDATGREAQPSYTFSFRVLQPSPDLTTIPAAAFDWFGRPQVVVVPQMDHFVDERLLSMEERVRLHQQRWAGANAGTTMVGQNRIA